jgi:phosphoribosylaminoimidazolecarboxamide formyltransferase/IMP cyclohydrolase
VAAFNRIAQYDGAISDYLSSVTFEENKLSEAYVPARSLFPGQSNGQFIKVQDLRYGENPHQEAALYRDLYPAPGSLVTGVQLQGKELSYNNIADADAAWECVKGFDAPACVIVKHANPCGVAVGKDALEAYSKAFQTDPTSAFGGIIAFNRPVDGAAAQQVSKQFVEVLMAPDFTPEALDIFKAKANVRLMKIVLPAGGATAWEQGRNAMDAKRVGSGLLLQTADNHELALADLKVVTKVQPTAEQLQDLLFAWKVAKYVKSNAIVFLRQRHDHGRGGGADEPAGLGAHRPAIKAGATCIQQAAPCHRRGCSAVCGTSAEPRWRLMSRFLMRSSYSAVPSRTALTTRFVERGGPGG